MFVRVEITTPGDGVQKSKVDGPRITMGRDPASQITFDAKVHSAVSWQHACIEMTPGGAFVTDLGSSNGTFVNGAQVTGKKTIEQGDVIGLGQTGPKLRIVEIALAARAPVNATVAEKMLPRGMLTPPTGSAPLNVSSDSMPPQVAKKRRRSPLGGIALGLLAVGTVAAAGFIVFNSQQKSNDKKDDTVAEKAKDDQQAKADLTLQPMDKAKESPKEVADSKTADDVKVKNKKLDIPPIPDSPRAVTPDPGPSQPPTRPPTQPPTQATPSPPIQAAPFSGAEIYRKTLQSTGWVTVPKNALFMSTGTGALVDKERRLFLTAYHVIEEATEAKIYFPRNDSDGRPIAVRNHYLDNERPFIGDVVARDSKRDLVVLRLRSLPESVTVLPLAAKGAEVADRVYTVGNPGVSSALWVYTEGSVRQIVFKKFRMNNNQNVEAWMLEAQFPINQGDSGGPVVNDKVELVGVNCSFSPKAQAMSNCVELREVQEVLKEAHRNPNPLAADPGLNRNP